MWYLDKIRQQEALITHQNKEITSLQAQIENIITILERQQARLNELQSRTTDTAQQILALTLAMGWKLYWRPVNWEVIKPEPDTKQWVREPWKKKKVKKLGR